MSAVKNKNIRAMAWVTLLSTLVGAGYGMYSGSTFSDGYYLFSGAVVMAYMGASKYGEVHGNVS